MALVAVLATATIQPAHADAGARQTANSSTQAAVVIDWPSIVVAVATSLFSGGPSESDIRAAVRQIITAINDARDDIIAHIDAIASAEVQACLASHTIEFSDIDNFSTSVLQRWAQEVTSCATLTTEFAEAVATQAAIDNIGYLIGPIYALAITARAKAGLVNGIDGLITNNIRGYETIVNRLRPACRRIPVRPTGETRYECVAYNGERAVAIVEEPADFVLIEERCMQNTSRPIAIAALPRLRALLG